MFEFSSPLFWYRLVFLAELLISEWLFTFKLKKRPYFFARAAASIFTCYIIAFLFPIFSFDALYISFMFVSLLCLTIAALYFCYDAPLKNVVFLAVAAYAVQHTAYELYTLITTLLNLNVGNAPYGKTGNVSFSVFAFSFYVEGYVAVYALGYALFGTKIKRKTEMRLGELPLLVISSVILIIAVFFNAVLTYRIDENTDVVILCMAYGLIMLCCVLALNVQFQMLDRKEMEYELDILKRLGEQERRHFSVFKENVDYINVKCHDLKHQIRRIVEKENLQDSVISEIEDAVMIYDSEVKTENEILDVILTEKRLLCVKNKITFSCIVDGGRLNFMSDADICSFFGNALDNAIEAVCRIEDTENRSIGMTVKASKGFVSVCIRNKCLEDLRFDDETFKTIKKDQTNHGFGLKSIKSVVQRYGGELSLAIEDEIFTLNALFPAPAR